MHVFFFLSVASKANTHAWIEKDTNHESKTYMSKEDMMAMPGKGGNDKSEDGQCNNIPLSQILSPTWLIKYAASSPGPERDAMKEQSRILLKKLDQYKQQEESSSQSQ